MEGPASAALRTTIISAFALLLTAGAPSAEDNAVGGKKPLDAVSATEKGKLQNPHKGDQQAAAAGHKLFMSAGCNGCHGGTGGGGMGPPLTNTVWIYGNDDDTLFRLITLGSQDLAKAGYSRKGTENVVGPMPPFKDIVKSRTTCGRSSAGSSRSPRASDHAASAWRRPARPRTSI